MPRRKLPLDENQARGLILDAYNFALGNTSVAAKQLGIHRQSLLRSVRELGLEQEIAQRWPHPGRVGYRALRAGFSSGADHGT